LSTNAIAETPGVNHLQIGVNRDATRHTEGRDNLSDKAAPASPAAAL